MRAERTSLLDAPGPAVAKLLFDPQTMVFVMRPLVVVVPIDPPAFPPRWVPGRYRVEMRLFGFIPLGWQDIVVTEIVADAAAGRWGFRDAGQSGLVQRFDHQLILEGLDGERSRYTDRLDVDAGFMTATVWLFARAVFMWRHRRWRVLIADKMRPRSKPL